MGVICWSTAWWTTWLIRATWTTWWATRWLIRTWATWSTSRVCIIFFAPSDTVKRPLYNKKKRIIRKILNIILAIIYVVVALILKSNYFYTLILTSLIIEVIVINPLTYKIFKQPYNNYKNKLRA